MKQTWSVRKLIYTGMLAAVAGVLMSFEFSVPMMPPFYKIDFSDIPAVIALFLMGPVPAACVEIIKLLIKLFTVGTNSMYVGEFANLCGIFLFVLPLWFVYRKLGSTRRAAVIALIANVPLRVAFSCFLNACITLPLYATAMGLSLDEVVRAVAAVNPAIQNLPTFLIMATIPFNLIKIGANYFISWLLYSRLSTISVFRMEDQNVKKLQRSYPARNGAGQ